MINKAEIDEKEITEALGLSEVMEVPTPGHVQIWRKVKNLLSVIKYWFVKPPKSNYVLHAERELIALGYDLNQKEEDPNKWICKNLFELLEVFGKQGHSGSSAPYCVNMFSKLALFEPLSPITCIDDEWNEAGNNVFQNNRCSAVFKKGKDGRPYYLDAISWKTQDDSGWNGTAEEVSSRQYIKLPFTPKTFYIDVIETEVSKDNWEFTIKDRSQLIPVFEYYDKMEG
jgi:hypothetical protein